MEMYKKREKQRACAALPVHSLLLRNSAMHGVKPSDPDPGQSLPGGPGGPGRPGGQGLSKLPGAITRIPRMSFTCRQ